MKEHVKDRRVQVIDMVADCLTKRGVNGEALMDVVKREPGQASAEGRKENGMRLRENTKYGEEGFSVNSS